MMQPVVRRKDRAATHDMTPQTKTHSIRAIRSVISFVRCEPEDLNQCVSRETGIPDSCTTDAFGRSGSVLSRDCADGSRRHFVVFHAPVEFMSAPAAGALAAHLCLHAACDALGERGIPWRKKPDGDEILAHVLQEIMEECLEFIEDIRTVKSSEGHDLGPEAKAEGVDWWPCYSEEEKHGQETRKEGSEA